MKTLIAILLASATSAFSQAIIRNALTTNAPVTMTNVVLSIATNSASKAATTNIVNANAIEKLNGTGTNTIMFSTTNYVGINLSSQLTNRAPYWYPNYAAASPGNDFATWMVLWDPVWNYPIIQARHWAYPNNGDYFGSGDTNGFVAFAVRAGDWDAGQNQGPRFDFNFQDPRPGHVDENSGFQFHSGLTAGEETLAFVLKDADHTSFDVLFWDLIKVKWGDGSFAVTFGTNTQTTVKGSHVAVSSPDIRANQFLSTDANSNLVSTLNGAGWTNISLAGNTNISQRVITNDTRALTLTNQASAFYGGVFGLWDGANDGYLTIVPGDNEFDFYNSASGLADILAGSYNGNGAFLTALNASALASGTVPTAREGSGTANNTTFLRGDQTWAVPAGGGGGTVSNLNTLTYGLAIVGGGSGGAISTNRIVGPLTVSGDGNLTNALAITPSGTVVSNALGSVTVISGNLYRTNIAAQTGVRDVGGVTTWESNAVAKVTIDGTTGGQTNVGTIKANSLVSAVHIYANNRIYSADTDYFQSASGWQSSAGIRPINNGAALGASGSAWAGQFTTAIASSTITATNGIIGGAAAGTPATTSQVLATDSTTASVTTLGGSTEGILQSVNAPSQFTAGSVSSSVFTLRTGNTRRWEIETTGHFNPFATLTYDIGDSTHVVRAVVSSNLTLTGTASMPTNTANYNFTADWYGTTLATRVTAPARRSLLMLTLEMNESATGSPRAQVKVEQNGAGGAFTNTLRFQMGGSAGSFTNTYCLGKLNPSAVVIVTDVSTGTGASVAINTSTLEEE